MLKDEKFYNRRIAEWRRYNKANKGSKDTLVLLQKKNRGNFKEVAKKLKKPKHEDGERTTEAKKSKVRPCIKNSEKYRSCLLYTSRCV